ncbi:hypothetical protein LJ753_01285 [Arthrobacter sp. zg-Y20]|uniref:hypothetical protein n=1 Tax=unclassified Arthrobacter TaxID=235627 RepID=UPI001D13362D|nr:MULTISPECIES: hypothetical protein [unclassified Arthrobacter]MCC3274502.1 hypothetical protein [Arthrobacter sp. zg-Y20]MDK1314659.1 hypothetical protein [Arthrobacter sp. zg.Y20]WIB07640.1 hypothetical protein QNO06_08035 [Arthrobacter sp. zg-Y20]
MDQLGNTERITEESGAEHQTASTQTGTKSGSGTACTLAVFRADPGSHTADDDGGRTSGTATDFPDGFSGMLALQNLESFDDQATGEVLVRVAHLIAWAEAQRARMLNRMETIFREDCASTTGRWNPGWLSHWRQPSVPPSCRYRTAPLSG